MIFQLVDEQDTAWHAGRSAWKDIHRLNQHSIGIEIVNLASKDAKGVFTFPEYNDEQIEAVIELCRDILRRNPDIYSTQILGHSDISPGRKHDPGPKFPWKKLYDHGIGAWYDEDTKRKYEEEYSKEGIPQGIEFVQRQLKEYGYKIDVTYTWDAQTSHVVEAFQMHFRPHNVSKAVDYETAAILSALVEKYKTKNVCMYA